MGIQTIPAASGSLIRKSQTFTSSGTFTLPAGYGAGQPLIIDAEVCGGGGGGGSGAYNAAGAPYGGGGGGSGVTSVFTGISLTANATITIGAGGAGGAASAGDGQRGAVGGASDINSIYYSPGGGGGGQALLVANVTSGYGVLGYGYAITPGYSGSATFGCGGAGGSGGAYSQSISANPSSGTFYRGGSLGFAAGQFTDTVTGGNNLNQVNAEDGKGLLANITGGQTPSSSTFNQVVAPSNLQRGGGGGGARGSTNGQAGGGGAAGTRFLGGLSGINNNSANKTGGTATEPSCGGGGGGGSYNNGGASGAGGAGAAGFVTIYWWG
jgi:hypothetical protein